MTSLCDSPSDAGVMERTFAMIKPDVVQDCFLGEVIGKMEGADLRVVAMRMERLSPERIDALYAEHRGRHFYDAMKAFLLQAPVVVLVLEGISAIARYRMLMGATERPARGTIRTSVRGRAGDDAPLYRNGVHGSDSASAAAREIALFFPGIRVDGDRDPLNDGWG